LEVGAAQLGSMSRLRDSFSYISSIVLLRLAEHSPLLHTLDLTSCTQHSLTPDVIARMACAGKNTLHTLRLGRSALCTDAGLFIVAAHLGSGLRVFDVRGSGGQVTDKGVAAVSAAAPHLEAIDLSASAVSEAGLQLLLQHCPGLSVCDVSSCRGLSRPVRQATTREGSEVVAALKHALGMLPGVAPP